MSSYSQWFDEPFGEFHLTGYKRFLQRLSVKLPQTNFWFKIALILRKLTLLNRLAVVDASPLNGFKVRLYPLDNVGDRLVLFMPWFFEREEFKIIKDNFKEGTFMDVGANTGYYSLLASKFVRKKGRVLALEPNPVMHNRLLFNLHNNDETGNIQAYNVGLADRSDEFNLYLDPKNLGRSTIIKNIGKMNIKVQCKPLVDFVHQQHIDRIDFMKIDVEGAEPMILNHFFKNARKSVWPKMILIETAEGIDFEALGYSLQSKTKHNSFFVLN